ncbi:MAG: M6 family metalloprotease domain-containing protein, partial [Deltaproteobacteria bacterium]|nr:M6 family metalloprotease domain-containing protein [Deltaproteobacteria bacterium]
MTRRAFAFAALAVYLCFAAAPAVALPPPRPGLVDPLTQRYRTTGRKVPLFPKEVRGIRPSTRGGRIPLAPWRASVAAGIRPLAVDTRVQSVIRPLVLLVDFADRPASASPSISSAAFDTLFFGSGASDLSVRNYWNEVSYGNFSIQRPSALVPANPDVVGWLRAGGTAPGGFPSTITSSYQVADVNVANIRQLLDNAIASLSAQGFDFSPYVRPSDGTFSTVILVHPGTGQEDSGLAGVDPYSHTAQISPIATAAGNIVDYTIVPAKQYFTDPTPADPLTGIDPNLADDPLIGVGVIVHEMGHLLGLPDLYPTSTTGQVVTDNVFSGAGVFDLMAYGMWGNNLLQDPAIPAHLSAWSKSFLGWLTPTEVASSSPRSLRPVEIFPEVDKVYSNTKSGDPTQYLLVENREQASTLGSWLFDRIGMSGVLIWQIDEAVINAHLSTNDMNSNPAFRGVYVKEADGVGHMGLPIPAGNPNDQAAYFGQQADLFLSAGQVFDRTNPSTTVNSSPIVDNTFTNHPADFGLQVSILSFSRTARI